MEQRTPRKVILQALAIIVASFGLGAVVSVVYQLYEPFPIELASDFWLGDAGGHSHLYFITTEKKQKFESGKIILPQVVGFRRYTLHSWDLPDGNERTHDVLGDRKGREGGLEVLGLLGARLWLWNDQLEARDLDTLEVRGGASMIREANPELAQLLPNAPEFFRVSAWLNTVVVKSLDARYFTLADQGWKLNLLDDESHGMTELDCRLRHWAAQGERCLAELGKVWHGKANYLFTISRSKGQAVRGLSVEDYLDTILREEKAEYALLSPEERGDLYDRALDRRRKPYGDVARLLYRAPYRRDRRGEELVLDLDRMEVVGNERFLTGGLLVGRDSDEDERRTWRLESPPSVLVLHKKTLGEHTPWQLTRLGLDGKILWQINTGLSVLQQFLPADHAVVIGGYESRVRGTSIRSPFQIVMVDVKTGKTVVKSLKP